MGLFSFGNSHDAEERALSVSAEAAFAAGSEAGYNVTPISAMNLTAVYSCMYVLSSSLAQLPVYILKRGNDTVTHDKLHPAHRLLSLEPNQFQTSYKWRETEEARRLGWGNSYTRIIRHRGEPVGLEPLSPWNTALQYRELGNGRRRYYYSSVDDNGMSITIPMEDMIHLKDFSFDGKMGMSRICSHSTAIGWGLSMQDYGKSFFGSNGRPTGVISPKGELGDDAWSRFKKVFSSSMQTIKSGENKTMLLPAEVAYQSFTIPPEDMQFLQSRQFSWTEICSLFNVPQHMTQNLDKATFNNTAELGLNFVKHTMMPIVINWEQELNRKIFTDDEIAEGYYIKFDLAGLLRGTPKDRAEFYKAMIDMGVYSRNEVRAMEDKNPIDGLDTMVISQNLKSIDEMDAEVKLAKSLKGQSKKESK